jgi:hypothetical protein
MHIWPGPTPVTWVSGGFTLYPRTWGSGSNGTENAVQLAEGIDARSFAFPCRCLDLAAGNKRCSAQRTRNARGLGSNGTETQLKARAGREGPILLARLGSQGREVSEPTAAGTDIATWTSAAEQHLSIGRHE